MYWHQQHSTVERKELLSQILTTKGDPLATYGRSSSTRVWGWVFSFRVRLNENQMDMFRCTCGQRTNSSSLPWLLLADCFHKWSRPSFHLHNPACWNGGPQRWELKPYRDSNRTRYTCIQKRQQPRVGRFNNSNEKNDSQPTNKQTNRTDYGRIYVHNAAHNWGT